MPPIPDRPSRGFKMRRQARGRQEIPAEAPQPARRGLLRGESSADGAAPLRELFSNLRGLRQGELIGEHPDRRLEGARLRIDRSKGHGNWELYRLGDDFFVVASDFVYDDVPMETEPGEGLIELHLRLAGTLEMTVPGTAGVVTVKAPQLLMIYLPAGISITERIRARQRDASVTIYCTPKRLRDLATQNRLDGSPLFEEFETVIGKQVWFRTLELTPTLRFAATTLLESPYRGGVRLLHAEAKSLEILCEVFTLLQQSSESETQQLASAGQAMQLETARRLVTLNVDAPFSVREIARKAGMSESKLKRLFKARYGVTVFHYGLECRMKHALELLRCRRMAVGQVAHAVGYTHQTSFAAAFSQFFGFSPRKARSGVH
jgi:AraC family transcriptional regulator, transcriptional activator of the genes for pyochelin and ferripyochelin receptors